MKKYKHTWFNGMLEDPIGEWVKEKEATQELNGVLSQWVALHSTLSTEETTSLILKWLLSLSILGNIGQLIYHLNT